MEASGDGKKRGRKRKEHEEGEEGDKKRRGRPKKAHEGGEGPSAGAGAEEELHLIRLGAAGKDFPAHTPPPDGAAEDENSE